MHNCLPLTERKPRFLSLQTFLGARGGERAGLAETACPLADHTVANCPWPAEMRPSSAVQLVDTIEFPTVRPNQLARQNISTTPPGGAHTEGLASTTSDINTSWIPGERPPSKSFRLRDSGNAFPDQWPEFSVTASDSSQNTLD